VDIEATADLLLLIQQKLRIVQYRYSSLCWIRVYNVCCNCHFCRWQLTVFRWNCGNDYQICRTILSSKIRLHRSVFVFRNRRHPWSTFTKDSFGCKIALFCRTHYVIACLHSKEVLVFWLAKTFLRKQSDLPKTRNQINQWASRPLNQTLNLITSHDPNNNPNPTTNNVKKLNSLKSL